MSPPPPLAQAGSGVLTLGLSDSPGVPATTAAATLTAQYNNLESVKVGLYICTVHLARAARSGNKPRADCTWRASTWGGGGGGHSPKLLA